MTPQRSPQLTHVVCNGCVVSAVQPQLFLHLFIIHLPGRILQYMFGIRRRVAKIIARAALRHTLLLPGRCNPPGIVRHYGLPIHLFENHYFPKASTGLCQ